MDFAKEHYITFKEGLPGFENLKQFVMLEDEEGVFYYLQSVEDQQIMFPIISPYKLMTDYSPNIHESYFEKLGGGPTENFTLFVIVTMRGTLEEATVNLQGPLLIHTERRAGIQAIVEDEAYKSRHSITELMIKGGV